MMNIRKGQWVSVKNECFVRLKKNGIKGMNNKFKVSKGTNKENGFVELETSPHKIFVRVTDIADLPQFKKFVFPALFEISCEYNNLAITQFLEDAKIYVGCTEADGQTAVIQVTLNNNEEYKKLLEVCQANHGQLKMC